MTDAVPPPDETTASCVILVPVAHHIDLECEAQLRELENRGYVVRRVPGYSAIDQARNQLATDALADGFDELMWIDSDIIFEPDDVDRLRRHNLPLVCGVYPKKGTRAYACNFLPQQREVRFGSIGGLIELDLAGFGFMHTRREVYETIRQREELPLCNRQFGREMLPFFQPLIREDDGEHFYLAEDYAFCHRAKRSGFRIMADTTIHLWHVGQYRYGWEDAGNTLRRYASYTFHVNQ